MTFRQFKTKAEAVGLTALEHTIYHWQLRGGGLIVNYYPTTRTLYANGTHHGRKCDPETAIQIAVESKQVNTMATVSKRKYGAKARKEWKVRKIASHAGCHYCGAALTLETATVDHFVPLSAGGIDHQDNWVLSCLSCNGKKGNTVPGKLKIALENNTPNRKRQSF